MPTTCSPRSSSALATWKPMNPAAPVRRIDIILLALSGEFNPRPVGRGNFLYLVAAPPARVFVHQRRASGGGRGVPGGRPSAAAEGPATASARTELQGFPLAGYARP